MSEEMPPSGPVKQPNPSEVSSHPAIKEAGIHAAALKTSLQKAAEEGIPEAAAFLEGLEALQMEHSGLFPTAQPTEEPESITTGSTDQPQAIPTDVSIGSPTTLVNDEVDDKTLAERYPVTDESRQIVQELQEVSKDLDARGWNDPNKDQIVTRAVGLRRQLSDSLSLPDGRNVTTLEAAAARVKELEYDTLNINDLIRFGYGGLSPAQFDTIMVHASPQIQEAYRQYTSTVAALDKNDYKNRGEAEKILDDAFDAEAGITKEEVDTQYQIGGLFPSGFNYVTVEEAQPLILQAIWTQIRTARTAQSVFTRRDALIKDMAARAGLSIYKAQSGVEARPLGAIHERAATIEGAHALVEEAIQEIGVTTDGRYMDDNLRSPQITKDTFTHGLVDTAGLTVVRNRSNELGKGAVGTVFLGRARGGIAGLRGNSTETQEIPVAVKTTTIAPGMDVDHTTAKWILSTIEEAHVLDEIRKKQQELYPRTRSFVPDSVLVQNYRGAPALVMEYLDRESGLYSQRESLSPQQLNSLFVQYFQLQDVIHKAGFTCNDVKGGDLYYKPEDDRLVVLDWNVTRPISSPPKPENIGAMNGDLLMGLQMFEETTRGRLTPEGGAAIRSLEQKITASQQAQPFDATEVIRTIKQLPLVA